ncbi:HEPN/Toprim-associated domain-containing protein [Cellulosimicrobium sp. ES-005]|uniref:HEPN/Toprim-associated domain-containing protein n=1 Tax=Cellulosimicrobium sp. ES-005 TaxID=3163031 RepID=A0AAU8FWE1_9MICO
MSSYAAAYLDDGRPICWFRNGVDEFFLMLFTEDDWIELSGQAAATFTSYEEEVDDAHLLGFRTTGKVLRDRLDLVGVSRDVVAAELATIANDQREYLELLIHAEYTTVELSSDAKERADYWAALRWETWIADLARGLERGDAVDRFGGRQDPRSASGLMSVWEAHDPRFYLRAVLEALPETATITLNLADVLESGWLAPPTDPQSVARGLAVESSEGLVPPIVLVEGRFDVEVLAAAIRLRRPHLTRYIKLPDFAQRAEGGAGALRQTVRAFAAAAVPNRVLALFDNDAAARDVLRTLPGEGLPSNIQVTCLPELDLAQVYPTIGAQGRRLMDVNGLAVSIELFLGTDVLSDGKDLVPVRWGGYVRSVGAYQGELLDKAGVQERFKRKVEAATSSPEEMRFQDWSALDLLLDHITGMLTRTGRSGRG